ncbi:unnamed protein product [Adineta ricciae]|uniref:Uncharacterized protein n=1 Tax=Adineta ricciae TaxID=249248 RepID=A0A813N261_ADIRI|nr:unnamed protein product [Adineta ricciae]
MFLDHDSDVTTTEIDGRADESDQSRRKLVKLSRDLKKNTNETKKTKKTGAHDHQSCISVDVSFYICDRNKRDHLKGKLIASTTSLIVVFSLRSLPLRLLRHRLLPSFSRSSKIAFPGPPSLAQVYS